MTRAEKVAEARRLRAEGLKLREIGERMGVPLKTASSWIHDPLLSRQRARRVRYAGRCVDCGAQTDGSSGPGKSPARCHLCAHIHQHESRYWTREAIVGAIQAWADEHGEPPTARDLEYGHPGYPTTKTVQHEFGTWNAAISAAGFEPFGLGKYGRPGEDDDLCREIRERYEQGESTATLALAYGCTPGAIRWRIAKVGGVVNPREKGAKA